MGDGTPLTHAFGDRGDYRWFELAVEGDHLWSFVSAHARRFLGRRIAVTRHDGGSWLQGVTPRNGDELRAKGWRIEGETAVTPVILRRDDLPGADMDDEWWVYLGVPRAVPPGAAGRHGVWPEVDRTAPETVLMGEERLVVITRELLVAEAVQACFPGDYVRREQLNPA